MKTMTKYLVTSLAMVAIAGSALANRTEISYPDRTLTRICTYADGTHDVIGFNEMGEEIGRYSAGSGYTHDEIVGENREEGDGSEIRYDGVLCAEE